MARTFDKDTQLCLSISARPSSFGTRFHNFLYEELGLNFIYRACAVDDIAGAVQGIRALKIRGSAVSMPFKEKVMALLDHVDPPAREIGAVNTIVNDSGRLSGYNTDALAVAALLKALDSKMPAVLLGSGGMAKAIAHALAGRQFSEVTIVSRNENARANLAKKFSFRHSETVPTGSKFLLNATPIGMRPDPSDRLPFSEREISDAHAILDSVASPSETALVRAGRAAGHQVVTGFQIVTLQAVEQFRLYTGITPDPELASRAAEHARV